MKLLMYSFFVLLLAPCNAKKAVKTAEQDNSKAVITFQTTACFGRCPIYTLTINGENKTATFMGVQNTEKIGTYTKSISKKELDELITAFEGAKFMSLENEYMGPITDFPVKITTYTNNGQTKKIKTRSNVPEEITNLEKRLIEIGNSEGWKKSEDSSNSKD